jgi:hypothetical protein
MMIEICPLRSVKLGFRRILKEGRAVEWSGGSKLTGCLGISTFHAMGTVKLSRSSLMRELIVCFFHIPGDAHKMIDMSHIVHKLNFGENPDESRLQANALKDFHSEKEIR